MRARVIATFGRQSLIDDAAHIRQATRRGRRGDVVVGDCVLASVTSAEQARIESIEPRSTLLFRTDKYRTKELAANVDQVIIVFAARPAFNRWFIWKALVAATAASIEALVLRNKTDLAESDDASSFLQQLSQLGWRTLALSAKVESDRSRELLLREVAGRKSLMVGQSGMGKSTLLNLLIPDARARTQQYSERLNVKQVFVKELEAGGFQLSTDAAADVLVLRPAIINLDMEAPPNDWDPSEQTYSSSAGQMTLYLELYDSLTSTLLARVIDPEAASNYGVFTWQSQAGNISAADGIMKKWSDTLRGYMEAARSSGG